MRQSYINKVFPFNLLILTWLGLVYHATFNATFNFARDWICN